MKSRRFRLRFRSWVSVLFLSFLACTAWVLPNPVLAAGEKVTILHTNDMHAHLLGFGPEREYTPLTTGDDPTRGGMARIAGKVNEIRQANDAEGTPTLLVDGGDFTMGTAFMLLSGEPILSVMDGLGYDALTLGNHEFDWTPDGTASILSYIGSLGLNLPVVASNLIFDPSDPGDDLLEGMYGAGNLIQPYFLKSLSNGIVVGFFGLIGEAAVSVAPLASPVTFEDTVTAAQNMVAALVAEGADLVVCLSHSGIDEDSALAQAVPGIDVIISGHTHEKTPVPVLVENTVIVQAGDYTRNLGHLDLVRSDLGWAADGYQLLDIDDSIPGDASIQAAIDGFISRIDSTVLGPMGYPMGFAGPVAETEFNLTAPAGQESNLGNLVADAMRWMVNQYETADPVDFALESNGVIRDDILAGTPPYDKNISLSDAFRAVPLGVGLNLEVGYPMVAFYMTGFEVKKALELIVIAYPMMGGDYWLNVSGLRYEYIPNGLPLLSVVRIKVGDEASGYVPLVTSAIYKIALNYYVAQFIAGVPALIDDLVGVPGIGNLFQIIPKDASGNSYLDPAFHPGGLDEARVDIDPETPDIQELQEWEGFLAYLATFTDTDADSVPNVPDLYSGPTGRIVAIDCFVATAAYGSALEPRIGVLRSFRDRVLEKSEPGRALAAAYYEWGKMPAAWLNEHEWARAAVRVLLYPAVGFAKVMLWFAS
ncbi:MAG: bifunctional UDP-sugar hydrolase/5'-nucleotidase [bacterium]